MSIQKIRMFRANPLPGQAADSFAYPQFAQLAGRLIPHRVQGSEIHLCTGSWKVLPGKHITSRNLEFLDTNNFQCY